MKSQTKTAIMSILILISLVPLIILIFKALEYPIFNTAFYFLGALMIAFSPKIEEKLTL
ncbi:MAG: hypothetical protein R3B92_00255 [Patescibacteria group bacterium]